MAAMAREEIQDFQAKMVIWDQEVLMYVKGIPTVYVYWICTFSLQANSS